MKGEKFRIAPVRNIEDKISEVDMISCATLSETPLVPGKDIRKGQHIDLVGAYNENMRESDDEAVQRASVFVDSLQGGIRENGDIGIPLQTGILEEKDLKNENLEVWIARISQVNYRKENKVQDPRFNRKN